MNCKDCIHYDICEEKNDSVGYRYKCKNGLHFKDKNKIIELPSKDEIYLIFGKNVYNSKIVNIFIEKGDGVFCVYITLKFQMEQETYMNANYTKGLGITLFYSKAEAENKLKG